VLLISQLGQKNMREMQRTFMSAIATGIVPGSLLILRAFSTRVRFRTAFDSIYVGMPRADEAKVLSLHHVNCGLTEPAEHGNSCTFSDPWISDSIAVDPRTNKVGRKLKGTHSLILFNRP
jgi:hypothetical protein